MTGVTIAQMLRCSFRREEFPIILGSRNLGKQGNLASKVTSKVIMTATLWLDNNSIFGRVIGGLGVVHAIEMTDKLF